LNAEKNSVLSGLAQSSPGGRRPGTAVDEECENVKDGHIIITLHSM